MTNAAFLELTLHDALVGLGNRDFSAVELVQCLIDQQEQTEPRVHAFVETYAEESLQHARDADALRQRGGTLPPLLGIPVGIKDVFDIAGKPTRCNSLSRATVASAREDAAAVRSLRRDGAIVIGKTVTQEFAAGVACAPCRNPWDLQRIPGGSSGGSATAVAVGSCLGAIGTDSAGSVSIPAAATATVGLKPTFGRVSTAGAFPLSMSLDTVGAIARTVRDALLMTLSLTNQPKRLANEIDRKSESTLSLSGLRIGVLTSYVTEHIQPDVAAGFERACTVLRELGAEIIPVTWADAGAAQAVTMLTGRVELASIHRAAVQHTPELIGNDLRQRVEMGAIIPGDAYVRARVIREAVKRSIAGVYRDHGLQALAIPSMPITAPRVDALWVTYPDGSRETISAAMTRHLSPWNATGQPVITLPCGFDSENLPIGLSIVGRPDEEQQICAIAHAYERSAKWVSERPAMDQASRT